MMKKFKNKSGLIKEFLTDSVRGFLFIYQYGKGKLVINLFLIALQTVLPLLSLIILKKLIDGVVHSGIDWSVLIPQLLLFALLQLLQGIATQFGSYFLSIQQYELADQVSEKVLQKAVSLDLNFFENPEQYSELHMAQQQAQIRPSGTLAAYLGTFQNFFSIILLSGVLVLANWSLCIFILVFSLPFMIGKVWYGYQQYLLDKETIPSARRSSELFQYLTTEGYAKEVRLFGYGSAFTGLYKHLKFSVFKKRKELQTRYLTLYVGFQLFETLAISCVYALLIAGASKGSISVGGLVVYFQVFQRLQSAISGFYQSLVVLFQNQLYLRQIMNYLAMAPNTRAEPTETKLSALSQGIQVRDLNFTYPNTAHQILCGVKMEFRPGTLTAVVGENGSGKSTLMKLLCGFYEPGRERIFWDETDLAEVSPEQIWKETSVVFQDFGRYFLTVQENIAPGVKHPGRESLEKVVELAGLTEKLKQFPSGMKTQLGRAFKGGEQLSGGQWQKLAVARMLYKPAKVLILDEPTSMMDPLAESEIFSTLKKEIGNKTIILITHRLYNLKIADKIYVMERGKIAESGSFDELISKNGVFARMYQKQVF